MVDTAAKGAVPGDLRMAGQLWPVLLASAVGLLPYTVFSTFLVPIADATGGGEAAVGGLRGLGGLAALAVGTAFAPLIGRLPVHLSAAGALLLLAVSSLLGAAGTYATIAAFCVLVGAATAVLNPALATAAADRYGDGPAAARAATLVTATQSMTAMLAAPVIAVPALWWGWRGDLVATAVVAAVLAMAFLRRGRGRAAPAARLGYVATFRALAAVPGARSLLLVALLRTAAFMGYLAYLAAFYDSRFDLSPGWFAFVWTLSGTSFFLGNLVTGRLANAGDDGRPRRLLLAGLAVAVAAMFGVFLAPTLPVALVCTAALGASHAVVAACVVSLLVRRCGAQRGPALSLNAAGMSLGVFVGATAGGIGLGAGGYPGAAVALAALTAVALVIAAGLARSA
ncbi:MFS transporter [Polymorphospora lycopeni]|uniref:MFS transporter n=1 Tax=Polymorphospora lycopeni TaxID=3140240 RepID=A0ABV5CW58_9ACTN